MKVITSLAQSIAGYLLKNKIIESKNLDIYIYGFEVMISSLIGMLIALLISMLFSSIVEGIIFLLIFVFMRKYCGGYHAETYLKCNIIFAANVLIVMLILNLTWNYSLYLHFAVSIFCVITYCLLAPIESIYKPLSKEVREKCRKISIVCGIVLTCISSILCITDSNYSVIVDMALLSVAISMVIERIIKGGVHV